MRKRFVENRQVNAEITTTTKLARVATRQCYKRLSAAIRSTPNTDMKAALNQAQAIPGCETRRVGALLNHNVLDKNVPGTLRRVQAQHR